MKKEIKIEGNIMDLGEGWTLELFNPMLTFAGVPGSRVYDIKLPDTRRNERILGNIQHPSVRATPKLLATEITEGGNIIDTGFSLIKPATDGFSLGFTSNFSEFFGQYQSKSLQKIDFGTVVAPADWDDTLTNSWSVGGYVLPSIKNAGYYENGNAPAGWNGVVNEMSGGSYTAQAKVPFFFLKHIINEVARLAGVTMGGDFWSSDEMNRLLCYNTRSVSGDFETRTHLPAMTIADVLLNLRRLYNIVLRFDVKKRTCRMDLANGLFDQLPFADWSNKMKRITNGTPIWTEGLRLRCETDGGDGLKSDPFFFAYETASTGLNLGYNEVPTAFSSFPLDGGVPVVSQPGITTNQLDKAYGNRLLYWLGGGNASNAYNGVALRQTGADGLAANFWQKEESFKKLGYRAEEMVDLTAFDVAKLAAIFSGANAAAPIIHAWGNDWLIEQVSVPDDGGVSKVSMWRL